MAIDNVQGSAGNVGNFANNTVAVSHAYPSDVTSGNLLVVGATKYSPSTDAWVAGDLTKTSGAATIGTVVLDGQVNFNYDAPANNHVATAVWSVPCTGSGPATFQAGGAVAGSYLLIALSESSATAGWSSDGASRRDGTPVTATSTTTDNVDTGNMTSTAGALFFGACGIVSLVDVTITPDAAFTQVYENENSDTDMCGAFAYRIVSSGTTDSASWTASANDAWSAVLVVYREPASRVLANLRMIVAGP